MITIHNVRLGRATNSSSSHSIVILRAPGKDDDVEKSLTVEGFGWETFTAASQGAKTAYLAQTLAEALRSAFPDKEVARAVCKAWLGHEPQEGGYVDHESLLALPSRFGSEVPSREFVQELHDVLLSERVAILGGNDNSEDGWHPLRSNPSVSEIGKLEKDTRDVHVCRKDPLGFWTIMNRTTGAKVRLTLSVSSEPAPEPECSTLPELVDVKITKACDGGCEFCYADAKYGGEHASMQAIRALADALEECQVFEVVLGGGEPLCHPELGAIVENFAGRGIGIGLTTHDPVKLCKTLDMSRVDALGVSCRSRGEVHAAFRAVPDKMLHDKRVTVQVIAGCTWTREVIRHAVYCGLPVLVLAPKLVGRGKNAKWEDVGGWLDEIDHLKGTNYWPTVSVDSALAAMFKTELKQRDVSPKLYTASEGKFSMYVDAINRKAGPCSWCEPQDMIEWGVQRTFQHGQAYDSYAPDMLAAVFEACGKWKPDMPEMMALKDK